MINYNCDKLLHLIPFYGWWNTEWVLEEMKINYKNMVRIG